MLAWILGFLGAWKFLDMAFVSLDFGNFLFFFSFSFIRRLGFGFFFVGLENRDLELGITVGLEYGSKHLERI